MIRTAKNLEKAPFIVLDVDGYRAMQEDKVRNIAEAKADFVRRTGARVTLPPMSPYFRRIVHMHIASNPALSDLATESMGEGDYRQVVIRLKTGKKAEDSSEGTELSPVMAGTCRNRTRRLWKKGWWRGGAMIRKMYRVIDYLMKEG